MRNEIHQYTHATTKVHVYIYKLMQQKKVVEIEWLMLSLHFIRSVRPASLRQDLYVMPACNWIPSEVVLVFTHIV